MHNTETAFQKISFSLLLKSCQNAGTAFCNETDDMTNYHESGGTNRFKSERVHYESLFIEETVQFHLGMEHFHFHCIQNIRNKILISRQIPDKTNSRDISIPFRETRKNNRKALCQQFSHLSYQQSWATSLIIAFYNNFRIDTFHLYVNG